MSDVSIKKIKKSEKSRKWLGQDKSSDRIPGLIEMIVEGDDFIISGGAKNLITGKAATGSFKATGLYVGGMVYTKAQLTTMTKSGKVWKTTMPHIQTVLRQIRALHNKAVEKKTGFKGNDQLQVIGPKMSIGIGKIVATPKLGGQAGGDPVGSLPGTPQQEAVTLAIFKILLGPNSYKGPGGGSRITKTMVAGDPAKKGSVHGKLEADFDKICMGTLPSFPFNLSKLWPGLTGVKDANGKMVPSAKLGNHEGGNKEMREWYYHFLLQFERVEIDTGLPDDVFNVFEYDDFLKFIEKLVVTGPPTEDALASTTAITSALTIDPANRRKDNTWPAFGVITKKDSWNPADIWLVNTSHPKYYQTILRLKQSTTIMELNRVLMEAFRAKPRMIVGISLKKSDAMSHSPETHIGARLHYDLINFRVKGKLPELNPVYYNDLIINLPWDKTQMEFTTITNRLVVDEKKRKATRAGTTTMQVYKEAEMRIGSGASGTSNINIEYKPVKGGGQLGKVPKNLLPGLIQKITRNPAYKLPTWRAANDAIPHSKSGIKYTEMKALVKKVSACSLFTFKDKNGQMDSFIEHIMDAKNNKKKWIQDSATHKSVLMAVQMMQFYGTLVDIYGVQSPNKRRFNKFLKDSYNLAQKRGETAKSEFGPFGKLH